MKVEHACKLSADGIAKTKAKMVSPVGNVMIVSLRAKYNENQEKYVVTQYQNRQKTETAKAFRDPHKIQQWQPSRRFSRYDHDGLLTKSKYCLYLLVSKNSYRFNLGITSNIYARVYQLRVMWGEFDLKSSCIVYGNQEHLTALEKMLRFTFEEYQVDCLTQLGLKQKEQNWFDLDCFWYAKNEVRRIDSFREDKIYRIYNGIDLNAFIVEDTQKLAEKIDLL